MTENIFGELEGIEERVLLKSILEKVVETVESAKDMDKMANSLSNDLSPQSNVVIDLELEKKKFLKIIKKINSQRNRAGYQKMLAFAQRDNKNLVMDDCKVIIEDLLVDGLIYNDSKVVDKESFKVFENESEKEPSV